MTRTEDAEGRQRAIEGLLDRYEQPRFRGTLPCPPATRATRVNPRCGDELTCYVNFTTGEMRWDGRGCTISLVGADLAAELLAAGTPPAGETILQRLGVQVSAARQVCALLGLQAFRDAAEQ